MENSSSNRPDHKSDKIRQIKPISNIFKEFRVEFLLIMTDILRESLEY